jgi:hypothetical protein
VSDVSRPKQDVCRSPCCCHEGKQLPWHALIVVLECVLFAEVHASPWEPMYENFRPEPHSPKLVECMIHKL